MATHYQININLSQTPVDNRKRPQTDRTDDTFVYGADRNGKNMVKEKSASVSAEYMSQSRKSNRGDITPHNEIAMSQTHDAGRANNRS